MSTEQSETRQVLMGAGCLHDVQKPSRDSLLGPQMKSLTRLISCVYGQDQLFMLEKPVMAMCALAASMVAQTR